MRKPRSKAPNGQRRVQCTFRVDRGVRERVRAEAARLGIDPSDLMRAFVAEGLETRNA